MMILLAVIIGVAAALLLLTAGYLFGVGRGNGAREQLRQQLDAQAEALALLNQQHASQQPPPPKPEPADDGLRATLERLLNPLIQREKLSFDLAHLPAVAGKRGDLSALLDQIAEKGNFSAVLLCDADGWPLAANQTLKETDRLGATASLLLLLADRLRRDQAAAPLSLLVHDESNHVTLCRIFRVGGQRLLLTAVSSGASLTPTALDPALVKLEAALSAGN